MHDNQPTNGSQRPQPNCLSLPLEVVDKYFMADPATERFQYLTAQRICGRCAVQAACLVEAIQQPRTTAGVRGGESASHINDLRVSFREGAASAESLALNAIAHQAARVDVSTSPTLRSGEFADVPLIEPRPLPMMGVAR